MAFLGSYPLFDKDEPFFAGGAREMIEAGSYITAIFNDEPRYEKPIFFYILEILSFKVFGVNEFTARLPSALLALGLSLINYFSLRKFDEKLAFFSSLVLASSFEFFIIARMAITDMTLNFFMSTALICFFVFYMNQLRDFNGVSQTFSQKFTHSGFLYLAALAIAGGILTKGPIALLLPGFIVVVFLLYYGKLVYFIREYFLLIVLCLVISLALSVPWYIAAHIDSAGKFTEVFFLEENFNRFFSEVKIHKAVAWWFYFPVILIGFLPWTLFVPQTIIKLKNNWNEIKEQKPILIFAVIWFLAFFIFYSISGVKLINYILPAYLPLAILIAYFLIDVEMYLKITLGIAFAVYLGISAFAMPYLNEKKQGTLLEFVNSVPADQRIYSVGFESPVAVFYAKRKIHYIKVQELKRRADNGESMFLVIRDSEFSKIPDSYKKLIKISARDKKNFYGKSSSIQESNSIK